MVERVGRIGSSLVLAMMAVAGATWSSGEIVHAAPWNEPTTWVSQGVPVPDRGSVSADGRYILMTTLGYGYRLRDRATGQLTHALDDRADGATMIPDGSGIMAWANQDLIGNGPDGPQRLYRWPIPSGPPQLVELELDESLTLSVDSTSTDGSVLGLTTTPYNGGNPSYDYRAVVVEPDGTLDYPDTALPGPTRRSGRPTMSANGQVVAFTSWTGDYFCCSGRTDVVDRNTRETQRVDVAMGGGEPNGNSTSPQLSADGTAVLFFSTATNLVPGTTTSETRLYVRDLVTQTTELIEGARAYEGASISGDGDRISFVRDLPTGSDPDYLGPQAAVYVRSTASTHPISVGMGGAIPNGLAQWARISEDGETVIFSSEASNLVAGADGREIYARGPAIEIPPEPPSPTLVPVVPERLLDTRPTNHIGYTGPKPDRGHIVQLKVTGVGTTNVPTDATAVVLNITGTEATADGYVTVWPCGTPLPNASNLNLTANETAPNLVISRLGTNGTVCIYTEVGTHLIADISGYYPTAI